MTAATRPLRADHLSQVSYVDRVDHSGHSKHLHRDAALVLAATVVWLAATAWLRPLMLPDEGRYAGVAWEMLRSGNWLTPTLDGLPFFHKPPLFYWISAAALQVFGLHEGAARAASLVGGTVVAFALYLFARRWYGRGTARAALLVLLTQPLIFIASQFANLDMLVAGCIGTTVLLLAHTVLSAEQGAPARWALLAAWSFAALGVLAKGLIGVVLPALVVIAWLVATRRLRPVPSLLSVPGLLLFLAIAAPWFVAMEVRYPDFLHYFFVVQQFQRFSASGFNNVEPFWFYPAVLAVFGLPWVAWLVRARTLAWWTDPERGALRLLMGLWLLVVVVFFSLPQSKLIGYVLPAVPPLALLIADAAGPWVRSGRMWRACAGLAALMCIGIAITLAVEPRHSSQPLAQALHARMASGEPVVFVDGYFYDVAFYARLREPALVLEQWDRPDITQRDNWKHELADAARFAPAAAQAVLLTPQRLTATLCRTPTSWVVGLRGSVAHLPWLAKAQPITQAGDYGLWRLDLADPALTAALGCRETPSADPPSR